MAVAVVLGPFLDPVFDLAFEPGGRHFPDAPALRESPLAHHAPDRGSAEGNQLSEFFKSDVSHFLGLLSKAETNERFNDSSVHSDDFVFGGIAKAAANFPSNSREFQFGPKTYHGKSLPVVLGNPAGPRKLSPSIEQSLIRAKTYRQYLEKCGMTLF
jgi:hypothetical protein